MAEEKGVMIAIPESEYKFLCHCRDLVLEKLELEKQMLMNNMFVNMVNSRIKESI